MDSHTLFFKKRSDIGWGIQQQTQYRLYIVGELIEYEEIIQIDRVFVVPFRIYRRFEVGDGLYGYVD